MEVLEDIVPRYDASNPGIFNGDFIFVRDIQIQARPGVDAWARPKTQPVMISVRIFRSVVAAGKSDNIKDTLDYRTVYKIVRGFDYSEDEDKDEYKSLEEFYNKVHSKLMKANKWSSFWLELYFPKAMLHTEGVMIRELSKASGPEDGAEPFYFSRLALAVKAMTIPCIIGIGDHEKIQKQPVVVDFAIDPEPISGSRWPKSLSEIGSDIFRVSQSLSCLKVDADENYIRCSVTPHTLLLRHL